MAMDEMMSTGAPRVMLLILVTGLFSLVWSNDRRPESPRHAIVTKRFDEPADPPRIAPVLPAEVISASLPVSEPVLPQTTAIEEFAAFPREISPGRFIIVDRDGHAFEVTVIRITGSESPIDPLMVETDPAEAIEIESRRRMKSLLTTAGSEIESSVSQWSQPLRQWLTPEVELARKPSGDLH